MEAQPTTLPEWATNGDIVEPDQSKKEEGWLLLEKPPHQYENWRTNLVYQWLKWFRDKVGFGLDFDSPYAVISYDADDKVTQVVYYESVAMATILATLSLSYDADDRINLAGLSVAGGATFTSAFTYDASDRVTSIETTES